MYAACNPSTMSSSGWLRVAGRLALASILARVANDGSMFDVFIHHHPHSCRRNHYYLHHGIRQLNHSPELVDLHIGSFPIFPPGAVAFSTEILSSESLSSLARTKSLF